jgi:Flp pilus assembly protein TadG
MTTMQHTPDGSTPERRRQRGQTLVEFALTLLVFLMTVLGMAEFGIMVFRYNMMSDLAQEGARWAAVRGAGSGANKASAADVSTFVQSRAVGISVSVTTNAAPSTLKAGETVQVQVQHTFNPMSRIVPLGTITLSSTSQMIVAR